MAKRYYTYFPWIFIWLELILLAAVIVAGGLLPGIGTLPGLWIILPLWTLISLYRKDYKLGRTEEYGDTLRHLLGSVLWLAFVLVGLGQFVELPFTYGWSLLVYLLAHTGICSFYRVGAQLALRRYRAKGKNYRNALIIGKNQWSERLEMQLKARKELGIRVLDVLDNDFICSSHAPLSLLDNYSLDIIYLSQQLETGLLHRVIDYADEHYIKVKIIPVSGIPIQKAPSFSRYGDLMLINLNEIPLDLKTNRIFKRVFDTLFSLSVIVFVLSWMLPLFALIIKLESNGPVFFVQQRNGLNNKVFNCYKFRSMKLNKEADYKQAEKNDPRTTNFGRFIRKYSLDEMPQFFNVLLGDMSIVGPRPHSVPMNREFLGIVGRYNSRHKIKPGITGLAQIRGFRGEISYPHQIKGRVRLDYFYIRNWSFWLDLSIIGNTLKNLALNRENAY
jgi:putative colanic acid biosysnthesis UDP-glucose lipid carrier transferase